MRINDKTRKRLIKDIENSRNSMKEHNIYIDVFDEDMFMVHFAFAGSKDTPYEGGYYHGAMAIDYNYPFDPPRLYMITPTGRYRTWKEPIDRNNGGICTTMTHYHPETWAPACSISNVLIGFINLMCEKSDGGIGSIECSESKKREYAKDSIDHILKDQTVIKLFPDLIDKLRLSRNTDD